MGNGQRDPKRERFWRDVLARQHRSGLSVRAFCAGEGLAETALYAWRRTVRERDQEQQRVAAAAPAFVPVVVRREPCRDSREGADPIALELRGGRMLRLPGSMPAGQLAAIVRAIEGEP